MCDIRYVICKYQQKWSERNQFLFYMAQITLLCELKKPLWVTSRDEGTKEKIWYIYSTMASAEGSGCYTQYNSAVTLLDTLKRSFLPDASQLYNTSQEEW